MIEGVVCGMVFHVRLENVGHMCHFRIPLRSAELQRNIEPENDLPAGKQISLEIENDGLEALGAETDRENSLDTHPDIDPSLPNFRSISRCPMAIQVGLPWGQRAGNSHFPSC